MMSSPNSRVLAESEGDDQDGEIGSVYTKISSVEMKQPKRLSEMDERLAELLATRDLLRTGNRKAPSSAAALPLPDYMQ
jgi:hypothetical protein